MRLERGITITWKLHKLKLRCGVINTKAWMKNLKDGAIPLLPDGGPVGHQALENVLPSSLRDSICQQGIMPRITRTTPLRCCIVAHFAAHLG
jgi:hypothetical protein